MSELRRGPAQAARVLLAMCMILAGGLHAQELTNSRLISFEDELPGSWVYCMAEDSLGFLWIGTNGGLVRYDGSRMKIYRHSPDEESISGNSIRDIVIVGDTLWCAHDKGISRMDLANRSIRNFTFETPNPYFRVGNMVETAYIIMRLRDGSIWGGLEYDGMVHWDAARDTFVRVRPPQDMVKPYYGTRWSADHIRSVVEDRTEDGLL